MTADIIQFSHGNGFPAGSYRKLFSLLRPDFEIRAIDTFGHDPRHPVTEGWPHLVDELVEDIERGQRERGRIQPVLGVGHSLGGYLTFLAAVRRPDLFRAIVLLDAPIIGHWKGATFGMIKRLGLADRVTPAGGTRLRRREWPSIEEAVAHFRSRGPFRNFAPECLHDYVTTGTPMGEHGVRLRFDPEVEYRIYRFLPHHLSRLTRKLAVPAGFIGGRQSEEGRLVGLAHTRRHLRVRLIEGGHLFPFEHPQHAADALRAMLRDLVNR
ncbi:MAG: alpha/beta hydrolase [Betaproteobacteria bacterium]|nr:alpha/beta hydrolase [Betaproteobacteria bacterium]